MSLVKAFQFAKPECLEVTGPTSTPMKHAKKPDHHTPEFLVNDGAAPGSDICVTKSAHVTDVA
jgi:hypothetical protein